MAIENISPIGAAALAYARRGWPVFPLHGPADNPGGCTCGKPACSNPGKHPRTAHGFKDASTDPAQVARWWAKWPEASIGIATGERAGFWVLDVDGPAGEASIAQLEADHGPLPATLIAQTGGGGRHILFAHPEGWGATISAGKLGAGLDTRANGGYIVAAPSRHAKTGALYEWASDPSVTAIAPAPEWLPALMAQPKAKANPIPPTAEAAESNRARQYGLSTLTNVEAELLALPEDSKVRNNTLFKAVARIASLSAACGISMALAENILVGAGRSAGLGEDETIKTFLSGWKTGTANPESPPPAPERPPRYQRRPASQSGAHDKGTPDANDDTNDEAAHSDAGEPFDLESYLDSLSPDAPPLELAESLAPVWRDLAAEDDRAIVDAWKNTIAERFRLKLNAMAANIKAAREALKAEANARRKAQNEEARERAAAGARDRFGLDLTGTPYTLTAAGVGLYVSANPDAEPASIAPRPIWPHAIGRDVTTGETRVKLCWVDGVGRERSQWCRSNIASDREAIAKLDGVPVSTQRWPQLSSWLMDAQNCIPDERRGVLVASSIGWAEAPGRGSFFAWPGAEGVEFVGDLLPAKGTPDAWAEGLRLLVELGEDGYMGLAAVGLAAAAPLVRHVGRRRPILGIAATSSTGKTSILTYALSVWASPEALTIQSMNSTPKGVEEAAVCVPDLPVLLDDFQEPASERPKQAGHALYFLGNGQQRTTAKKDGGVSGGRPRWGVAFYASEYSIAGAMQGGADRRVVELTARPLPAGRSDLSDRIKAIGNGNGGAIAGALLAVIGPRAVQLAQRADLGARELRDGFDSLKGDDALTASLAGLGLELLAEATGITLPSEEVAGWLAAEAAAVRDERPDQSEEAFTVLVRIVDSASWHAGRAMAGGFDLAFVTSTSEGPAIDVNPTHDAITRGLEAYGGEKRHRAAWAERGLIHRNGRDFTARKKVGGKTRGVLRILREVCERFGMRAVPTDHGQVGTETHQVGTAESVVHRGF